MFLDVTELLLILMGENRPCRDQLAGRSEVAGAGSEEPLDRVPIGLEHSSPQKSVPVLLYPPNARLHP